MLELFDNGDLGSRSLPFADGTYSDTLPLGPCDPVGAFNFARIAQDRYCLTLAVPGFDEEDIDVSAKSGYLRISGVTSQVECGGDVLHCGLDGKLDITFLMTHPLEVAEFEVRSGLLRVILREHPGAGVETVVPPRLAGAEALVLAA